MGIFSEWKNRRVWTPIPSNHGDLDVENKLLGRDDIEASSRRTSDVSEEIRPLWTRNGFGISKTWLILTIFNAVILGVSVGLNESNFLDFTRSCIRETSAYCRGSSFLSSRLTRNWIKTDFQKPPSSSDPKHFHSIK
jgi:hypothetical protein